jgi:hypothetical protein
MYVLSTAITAMTIAIKTAAVGQSMAFLPSHHPRLFEAPLRSRRYLAEPVVQQGHWSHTLMPVVLGCQLPMMGRWTLG